MALMVSTLSVSVLASCRNDMWPRPTTSSNSTAQDSNSKQKSLSGIWGGLGKQVSGEKWTVVINLSSNNGTVNYASIPCSGTLKLIDTTTTSVTLRESITNGRGTCTDNGKVVLKSVGSNDDELQFIYYTPAGKEDAGARLKKFSTEADANTSARNQLSGKAEPTAPKSVAAAKPKPSGPPVFTTFGNFLDDLSTGKTSHITDMQTDSDGSTYVLSTRLNNASDFRTDPDGSKSFLSDIILTRIAPDKSVSQTVLDSIYCCDAKGFAAQRGTFKIEGNNIVVFYTEKENGSGYAQQAKLYQIGKSIIGQEVYEQPYFRSANWGWFPYFDRSGTLQHFSFAGYFAITEKNRGNSIEPNTFKNRMLAERMRQAGLSDKVETESQMSQAFLKAIKTRASAKSSIVSNTPVTAQPFAGGSTAATAAAQGATPLNNRAFPAFIDIPAQYTITTNKGCRLNNPSPKPNETVTWTGPCRNGLADGHGTMAWFENGKPNGQPAQEYLSKGFFLKPGPFSIFRTAVGDDNCRIIVPVNAVENMKSLFRVEYDGKCPRNASNLLYQDSSKARANILFNGQLFASFDGTVAMGAIPISGEMIFFDGTRFKFNGQNPFSGIITQEKVDSWFKSIDVVRGAPQSPQLSAESLNIKVGFNAKPNPPVEASGKLLVFSVDTISGATKLTMRYDIAPSQKAKLSARGYVVSLKAEVKLDTTTSMGWMGVGENNSIVKLVDVRLDKKDGYRATGEVLLSELQSYAHGMGVTITTKASRPTVTVVGITEEQ